MHVDRYLQIQSFRRSYENAKRQNGSFLHPRPILRGVTSGGELLTEATLFSQIVSSFSEDELLDLDWPDIDYCINRMTTEANVVKRCEDLLSSDHSHSSPPHLSEFEYAQKWAKRERIGGPAVSEVCRIYDQLCFQKSLVSFNTKNRRCSESLLNLQTALEMRGATLSPKSLDRASNNVLLAPAPRMDRASPPRRSRGESNPYHRTYHAPKMLAVPKRSRPMRYDDIRCDHAPCVITEVDATEAAVPPTPPICPKSKRYPSGSDRVGRHNRLYRPLTTPGVGGIGVLLGDGDVEFNGSQWGGVRVKKHTRKELKQSMPIGRMTGCGHCAAILG
eukprot:GHVO01021834.1.p1 GENE.GHVO01021834.1~~GHVO01021834.1.p1  ORF type:complete len:333 (+),score=46.28 GHVO01021834.1:35-1033(+)